MRIGLLQFDGYNMLLTYKNALVSCEGSPGYTEGFVLKLNPKGFSAPSSRVGKAKIDNGNRVLSMPKNKAPLPGEKRGLLLTTPTG